MIGELTEFKNKGYQALVKDSKILNSIGWNIMEVVVVNSKEDIFEQLRKHQKTLEGYGVRRCGLFGSFRRGEATENSDIDLLVEFKPELKTFMNFMDLCFFFDDLFGRKVDVLTPESLSPIFGHKILAEVEYVSFWGKF